MATLKAFFGAYAYLPKGHNFTISLKEPINGEITIHTGNSKYPDDKLHHGMLETSKDGKTFEGLATFKNGSATNKAPTGSLFDRIKITDEKHSKWQIVQDLQLY